MQRIPLERPRQFLRHALAAQAGDGDAFVEVLDAFPATVGTAAFLLGLWLTDRCLVFAFAGALVVKVATEGG